MLESGRSHYSDSNDGFGSRGIRHEHPEWQTELTKEMSFPRESRSTNTAPQELAATRQQ